MRRVVLHKGWVSIRIGVGIEARQSCCLCGQSEDVEGGWRSWWGEEEQEERRRNS